MAPRLPIRKVTVPQAEGHVRQMPLYPVYKGTVATVKVSRQSTDGG
jgi:hypothetical protein